MWKGGRGKGGNRRTQSGCIACAMPISPGFISIRAASFRRSGRRQGEHGKAHMRLRSEGWQRLDMAGDGLRSARLG